MKVSFNKQNILLVIGIFIFASYQFQIYWAENSVKDSVLYIEGGGVQRFFIKIFGIFLLYMALIRTFSISSFAYNFPVKIPLLYYITTVIVLFPIFISEDYSHTRAHLMAFNLVLFTPLLFINFYGQEGDKLFSKLIKITIWVIIIQLLADLVIKLFDLNLVNTILGGMGNANTFGLHLIIAALGIRFIYQNYFFSSIILILTFGTGSLICSLIALILLLQALFINFFRATLSVVFLLIITSLILFIFWDDIFSHFLFEFGPIKHAYLKVKGLITADVFNVGSVRGRVKWMIVGIELMKDNPLSIIFGHPGFLPFYTGDGFFFALLVTLGLPALLLFIASNIYLVLKGIFINDPLLKFASYTLIIYVAFFCTNRILDYWPSGFIYLLVFSYLCRVKNNALRE